MYNIKDMPHESAPRKEELPEGYSYHPEGYLWHVLPVEKFATLPETVNIDGKDFIKKSEFHVTVLNAREVAKKIAEINTKAVEDIEEHLQVLLSEYLRNNQIKFIRFDDDLRLAVSSERESIAARCTMAGLEKYFEQIQSMYGFMPEAQPTHVSIYTLTGAAVGIDSTEQMESYQKVELPEVQNILNEVHVF